MKIKVSFVLEGIEHTKNVENIVDTVWDKLPNHTGFDYQIVFDSEFEEQLYHEHLESLESDDAYDSAKDDGVP